MDQETEIKASNILVSWIAKNQINLTELSPLIAWELADTERAIAFDITPDNVEERLIVRANLWAKLVDKILDFFPLQWQEKGTLSHRSRTLIESLWKLWLPLSLQLATEKQRLRRPFVQGILGGQGTGKTTLATVLKLILAQLGHKTLSLSLDDLYKTYTERQQLREEDPRFIWRGPPGTHDIELGIKVLDELRRSSQIADLNTLKNSPLIEVPRFDKSAWGGAGDRTTPERVNEIEIVLFEGWFVGVRPIDPESFQVAPPPILTESDRQFARDINAKLRDYLPLWERCDRLMILYPHDYRLSQQWRCQAEQEMMATGRSGMTDEEVNQFVEYFWKALHPELFMKPLVNNAEWVNLVVEINQNHAVERIYRPRE
ncbi:MAG: glycerate kinase [Actinomycetota bacterium]